MNCCLTRLFTITVRLRTVLLFFCITCCLPAVKAGDIYVSIKGSDTGDGTAASPLKTLDMALRTAREWRRLGDARTKGGINILMAPGEYVIDRPVYLRPEDSGTPQSPTRIVGQGDVRLSGGMRLTGWQPVSGSVPTLVADAPVKDGRALRVRQLWTGGRKASPASLFGEGKMKRLTGFNTQSHTMTIPSDSRHILEHVAECEGMEMQVHQRWAIALLRVREMKTAGDGWELSFHEPESRLEFEHPWPQPVIGGEKGNSSFNLFGRPEFLDEAGEWWQDTGTGAVRYCPRTGETAGNLDAVVPFTERLMTVEGCEQNPVHDIIIQGITFQYAGWTAPLREGHVTLQGGFPLIDAYKLAQAGLPWNANLENQAWIRRPESAVSVSWARHLAFTGCTFTALAATGLDLVTGCKDIEITGNQFHDIGGTALLMGSFAEGPTEVHRPYRASDEAYCERLTVRDNTVTDATNEDWGAVGIGAGFVRHCRIVRNEVARVNYSGICVGWGWNTDACGMRDNHIDSNYVHHFARQLYDAGGIYTLSNQPGSTIKGNRIDSIGPAPYATNDRGFYIYLDEATDGYTISGNRCTEEKYGDNKPGPDVRWE